MALVMLASVVFVFLIELSIIPTILLKTSSTNIRWSPLSVFGAILFLSAIANLLYRIDGRFFTYEYTLLCEAAALFSISVHRKYNKTTTYLATFCVLETCPHVKLRETQSAAADKPRDAFVQKQLSGCRLTCFPYVLSRRIGSFYV